MQQLLRDTLAPLPDVQQALALLKERRCLIEESPTEVRLVSTGLPCWHDVVENFARQNALRLGRRVMIFLRTGSTNDVAWQCAPSAENDGLVVVADEQSAGRGRLGHDWVAKPEQSLLCSILLRDMPVASVDRLTLLAGLATAEAMEAALPATAALRVEIKWPNDLLVEGRKIAGILVERRNSHVVIGIGINVAQAPADFPPELGGRAASLYQATGFLMDRLRVLTSLLTHLDGRIAQRLEDQAWIDQWKSRCSMLGSRIAAQVGERRVRGQVLDVDPLRGLLVRDDAAATVFLSAQTTTLSI